MSRSVPPPRLPTPGSHRPACQRLGHTEVTMPTHKATCPPPACHRQVQEGKLQCQHAWQWRAGCLVWRHRSYPASVALAGGWRAGVGHILWGTEPPTLRCLRLQRRILLPLYVCILSAFSANSAVNYYLFRSAPFPHFPRKKFSSTERSMPKQRLKDAKRVACKDRAQNSLRIDRCQLDCMSMFRGSRTECLGL